MTQSVRKSSWWKAVQHAIGPLVLLAILYGLDLQELRRVLAQAHGPPVLLACLVMLPPVALRALRWRLLLGPVARSAGLAQLLAVYAHAIFVGSVTPGRIGELVKVLHVTRLGSTRGEALASVLLDRLYDVLFLAGVGGLGLWALALSGGFTILGLGSAVFLAGLALWLAWQLAYAPRLEAQRSGFMARLPAALRARAVGVPAEFRSALAALSLPALIGGLALTAVAWGMAYLANFLLAQSLGLSIGYLDMSAISAICSLVALLPISVMGAGTRDAVLIVILSRFGASPAEAVALSALMLGLTLWTALACGASRLIIRVPAESAGDRQEREGS